MKQELMEIYQQLWRLCRDLHRRRESSGHFNASPDSGVPSSPEEVPSSQMRSGLLTGVVKDLHELIKDIFPDADGVRRLRIALRACLITRFVFSRVVCSLALDAGPWPSSVTNSIS